MNELENTLQELKDRLDQLPLINEFLRVKEIYEKDAELVEMRENIARLASEGKKEEHQALLDIYNSHPIVVNYNLLREDVGNLLNEIKEILE